MRHALTYTALTHRAERAAKVADNSHSICLRSRMYYHRGLALRALVSDISNMEPQTNDAVIASVLSFLVGEIRHSPSEWQNHFYGAIELVRLRGGLESLARSSVVSRPNLLYLLM
ncbi:C6 zinc finger [Aspergillus sclerotialis]|uniref:C6 zinc finger n=1 Tax=Aspergillus sclerotialis TaxID=2070753 RepID=A0A3A2Z6Z7_9EURO|nr:C6 zinc finger [Aspergillus sclerotialis]